MWANIGKYNVFNIKINDIPKINKETTYHQFFYFLDYSLELSAISNQLR